MGVEAARDWRRCLLSFHGRAKAVPVGEMKRIQRDNGRIVWWSGGNGWNLWERNDSKVDEINLYPTVIRGTSSKEK
jgi:hypothetical protein